MFIFFSKRRRLLFKYLMLTDPFNGIKVEDLEKSERGNQLIEEFINKSKKLKKSKEVQFESFERAFITFESYPHRDNLKLLNTTGTVSQTGSSTTSPAINGFSPSSEASSTGTGSRQGGTQNGLPSLSLGQCFQAPMMMPDYDDLEKMLNMQSLDFPYFKGDPGHPFGNIISENILSGNGLLAADYDPDQHVHPDVEKAAMDNQVLLASVSPDVTALCFLLRKRIIEHR
ncbi:unnamed protein product [Ambrosiozyma monospora]|uniref:Unnamed protein product n=1 Tax=Ambrosiozyma monospora TaxID=43982 RepID=A0ACB5TZ59_AMBMO|nr:unnamed protein product [Ambrosiozyma monospora]